ncbi:helix-turn-helix domain-containing protein [Serratia sp. CY37345]|uniref:helix-turn-helix domain-containing protein n=1 Tax=Serratia sp. CY37345 TaxID=3383610 RepID=UPI003F9FD414
MNNFLPIDRDLLSRTDLDSNMKLIYAYLANFEFSCGKGNVFPSMEKISADLGINYRTVRRALEKLCDGGFLARSRANRQQSYKYTVSYPKEVTETATPIETQTIEETANECTSNAPAPTAITIPTIEPESQIEQPSQQTDNDHSDSAGACSGGVETVPNVTGWDRVSRKVWRSLKGRGLKKDSTRQEADTDARAYIVNRLQHFTGPLEGVINQWLEEESLSF